MCRGSGFIWDLRHIIGYDNYKDFLDLKIPVGINGDCYDRYLIRMLEMRQSNNLVNKVANVLLTNINSLNVISDNKVS
jgi:NADH-quinone oxidoreductase subunit D